LTRARVNEKALDAGLLQEFANVDTLFSLGIKSADNENCFFFHRIHRRQPFTAQTATDSFFL
jgi:hypothetical protein